MESSHNSFNTKKKGNTKLLKYWRPISLLCVDYEILTKILANRLTHILPEIISEEQNCSIPNRTIFNNLLLIRDIIRYTKEKDNDLYLLRIDQEKAFYKINRTFLYKTMEKMGISPVFINFIKMLYKQNTSMIIKQWRPLTTSMIIKQWIPLTTGITTKRPKTRTSLSLPLYVVQGQVTTTNVNHNKDIIGIHTPNKKKTS